MAHIQQYFFTEKSRVDTRDMAHIHTVFFLNCGSPFYGWMKPEYSEKTAEL